MQKSTRKSKEFLLQPAAAYKERHKFKAVFSGKLPFDIGDMILYSYLGDKKTLADFLIRKPLPLTSLPNTSRRDAEAHRRRADDLKDHEFHNNILLFFVNFYLC